jgi:ribonuclease HI
LSYHLGSDKEHTVFEGECVGELLALELVRREDDVGSVSLGVDNQAAIETLAANRSIPGHYIVDQIHRAYDGLRMKHARLDLTINWIPGHRGIPGSEQVDKAAKEAAKGHSSTRLLAFLRKTLPASKSAIKQAFTKHPKKVSARFFRDSPRFAKISQLDPALPSSKYCRMASHLP